MDMRTAKNLEMLGLYKSQLTKQQLLTLRGQILRGDHDAAFRGLARILMGGEPNAK